MNPCFNLVRMRSVILMAIKMVVDDTDMFVFR